jgi:hypothetical protein
MTFYTRGGTNVKVKVKDQERLPATRLLGSKLFGCCSRHRCARCIWGARPRHDSRRAKPRGGEHCSCELGEEIPAFQAGQSRAHRACWRSDSVTRALGPSLCLLGNIQDSSQEGSIGAHPPNSGRGAGSLITAEISLIANLNSLHGRKKFPVLMRRELARKDLMRRLFLLPLTRCGAPKR